MANGAVIVIIVVLSAVSAVVLIALAALIAFFCRRERASRVVIAPPNPDVPRNPLRNPIDTSPGAPRPKILNTPQHSAPSDAAFLNIQGWSSPQVTPHFGNPMPSPFAAEYSQLPEYPRDMNHAGSTRRTHANWVSLNAPEPMLLSLTRAQKQIAEYEDQYLSHLRQGFGEPPNFMAGSAALRALNDDTSILLAARLRQLEMKELNRMEKTKRSKSKKKDEEAAAAHTVVHYVAKGNDASGNLIMEPQDGKGPVFVIPQVAPPAPSPPPKPAIVRSPSAGSMRGGSHPDMSASARKREKSSVNAELAPASVPKPDNSEHHDSQHEPAQNSFLRVNEGAGSSEAVRTGHRESSRPAGLEKPVAERKDDRKSVMRSDARKKDRQPSTNGTASPRQGRKSNAPVSPSIPP